MATVDVMRQPNFNKKDLSISTSDEQTCDMEWETATDVDSVSESSDESISCGASMDCKDDQRLRASTGECGAADLRAADLCADLCPSACVFTVTVFDWDDTILASSFLQSNGHGLNTTVNHSAWELQGKKKHIAENTQALHTTDRATTICFGFPVSRCYLLGGAPTVDLPCSEAAACPTPRGSSQVHLSSP